MVHAVGIVRNLTARQRFGVRIELELLDDNHRRVGTVADYHSVVEPHAEWQFHTLIAEKRAVAARILGIKEEL
jgi:hypothetical protein